MKKIVYQKTSRILLMALLFLLPFFHLASAGDQIKSNEFFVGTYTGQVSTPVDLPFVMYLGDNLTGVDTPVKSAFFSISGVYTGGGSLQFRVDSDATTTKTFTLPSAGSPTDFNLIYQDNSGKLSHISAGVYNHTLNIIPSGVTISGLGAKLETTHQFAQTNCVDGPSTNQKVKTSEFFVASYTSAINSSLALPFSIYMGDDLTDITNPVKSFYFSISGVYSGGGSLNLVISDDGSGTSTNFLLPSVSSPANFQFIYKDNNGQINPASSGVYNYRLNMNVSGVTISNLGVKAVMTHRYKPKSCSAGYPPFGDLISAVYDSTASADGPAYNSIMWKGQLGGASFDQGRVLLQVAAADNSSGPWNYVGGGTCGSNDWYESSPDSAIEVACYSQLNNKRYFRYKLRLCSADCIISGANTPRVDDIVVNWSP